MDETANVPQEPGDLQFDRVEPAGGAPEAFACAFCATPLWSSYYEINGRPACEACRYRVEQEDAAGAGSGAFVRALVAGCAAAAAGCGLYYGVRALTGYEIGFVAIIVGFLVGGAVRWGTKGRGGRGYQVLAVFLTYMSISSTYLPMIFKTVEENRKKDGKTAAVQTVRPGTVKAAAPQAAKKAEETLTAGDFLLGIGALFVIAAAGPILAGMHSPILLLIVGFGLWEAWKINRRRGLTIAGPLEIRSRPAPVG